MILATHGIVGSQITQFVGLLDLYPSAAAAYSLRKLRTAYTGSAIEVRRTNNDVANIGFTSTGELDTAALLAFTGTGALDNGFVTKWYDQSGNGRNATQATAANQPRIVTAGSVITEGGKPAVDHQRTTTLNIAPNLNVGKTYSIYGVVKFDLQGNEIIGSSQGGYSYAIYADATNNYHSASNAFGSSNGVFGLNFALLSVYRDNSTTINQYKNSSILGASFTMNNNNDFNFRSLSGEQDILYNLDGKLSEAIIYSTNQISNQSGLEGNIKNYYGL